MSDLERRKRLSRRDFVHGMMAGGGAGLLIILIHEAPNITLPDIPLYLPELAAPAETFEQQRAREFLNIADSSQKATNIKVRGSISRDEFRDLLVFNKPSFPTTLGRESKRRGEIAVGTFIAEAIVVLGVNPGRVYDGNIDNINARWLAFLKGSEIVFAQERFFYGLGIGHLAPFDVWNRGNGI